MKKLQPLLNILVFLLFLFVELLCSQKISLSSINLLLGLIILIVESIVFINNHVNIQLRL